MPPHSYVSNNVLDILATLYEEGKRQHHLLGQYRLIVNPDPDP